MFSLTGSLVFGVGIFAVFSPTFVSLNVSLAAVSELRFSVVVRNCEFGAAFKSCKSLSNRG